MYRKHRKRGRHHRKHEDWQQWQNWQQKFRQAGFRRPKHNIPVNIIENETEFIAHVYAVSFSKDQINISVTGNVIYITGTRSPEDSAPNFLLQEYPIKSFERVFELSDTVDTSKISAKHENGVLTIIAPKTVEAQEPEHEIEIK